ncbi:MAG: rhodanese-like domain-containing protein [Betaproteobacteria bacterium]|nr:rhodanese-like domain-containing protein [Betaproteobacteria bacterium]MCL2886237.1 rhodanese-like domain-containing protein [Betaproteobacteria bacterium]
MRSCVRSLLLAACLALAGFAAHAETIDIDNAELARLIQDGAPLIDVRLPSEWETTGVIAGSRLNTFFNERGESNPAAWLEKIKPYARPDQPVIVICRTGNRTRAVSRFLSEQAGYATVYNVTAGIKGWLKERRPVVPASPVIAACRSEASC